MLVREQVEVLKEDVGVGVGCFEDGVEEEEEEDEGIGVRQLQALEIRCGFGLVCLGKIGGHGWGFFFGLGY